MEDLPRTGPAGSPLLPEESQALSHMYQTQTFCKMLIFERLSSAARMQTQHHV